MSIKSYVVNEKLRNTTELYEEEREFVKDLDEALEKMPIYNGNLQRSLYFNSEDDIIQFMEEHKVGYRKTYKEYLSTTKGTIYNPEGQVQIYIQNTKRGKDISELNEMEQEVVYPRNSSFLVENIVKDGEKYYILLEETDE